MKFTSSREVLIKRCAGPKGDSTKVYLSSPSTTPKYNNLLLLLLLLPPEVQTGCVARHSRHLITLDSRDDFDFRPFPRPFIRTIKACTRANAIRIRRSHVKSARDSEKLNSLGARDFSTISADIFTCPPAFYTAYRHPLLMTYLQSDKLILSLERGVATRKSGFCRRPTVGIERSCRSNLYTRLCTRLHTGPI
jgi:hypothetical protein